MFEIRPAKQPLKYLKKLPPKLQNAFFRCFEKLEENPFLLLEPLHGPLKGKWKLVLGNFRIICSADVNNKVIKIIFVKLRGDAYK